MSEEWTPIGGERELEDYIKREQDLQRGMRDAEGRPPVQPIRPEDYDKHVKIIECDWVDSEDNGPEIDG